MTTEALNFTNWTNSFCAAIFKKSNELGNFCAQNSDFVDQIVNNGELSPPNTEGTTIYLEKSLPQITQTIINIRQTISHPQIREMYEAIISGIVLVCQWAFSSDYFPIYNKFNQLFNESQPLYTANKDQSGQPKMWQKSMQKFVEYGSLQVMLTRFAEDEIKIQHFESFLYIFYYLFSLIDTPSTIEMAAQIFEYFKTFLKTTTPENFDERFTDVSLFSDVSIMQQDILSLVHNKSTFINGFDSYLSIIQIFIDKNTEDTNKAAIDFIELLLPLIVEDNTRNQLIDLLIQHQLLDKVHDVPKDILILLTSNISMSSFLTKFETMSDAQCIETMRSFNNEQISELIELIPDDNKRLPPLIFNLACVLGKPEIEELVISLCFDKFDLSNVAITDIRPLYKKYKSQLLDVALSHLNEEKIYITMCNDILQQNQRLITNDVLQTLLGMVTKIPVISNVIRNIFSKKLDLQLNKEQVENLLRNNPHSIVWDLFNKLILTNRAINIFNFDATPILFLTTEDLSNGYLVLDELIKNPVEKAKDHLINLDDLSNKSYLDFVYNYIVSMNIMSKNILRPTPSGNIGFRSSSPSSNPDLFSVLRLVAWPLQYFDYLMLLMIHNEGLIMKAQPDNFSISQEANVQHSIPFNAVMKIVNFVPGSLLNNMFQSFVVMITAKFDEFPLSILLLFLFDAISTLERGKSLLDYGIIRQCQLENCYEEDLPNEATVTYNEKEYKVRYDPKEKLINLIRSVSIQLKSGYQKLSLRTKDGRMLQSSQLPPEGVNEFTVTGQLTPLRIEDLPSYVFGIQTEFTTFLLNKLSDNLNKTTKAFIKQLLDYLPPNVEIQKLTSTPTEFLNKLNSVTDSVYYSYLLKTLIHRLKNTDLVNAYKNTGIFMKVKTDYTSERWKDLDDHTVFIFLFNFFNDTEVDMNLVKLLISRVLDLKEPNVDAQLATLILIKYANMKGQTAIESYLLENDMIDKLLSITNEQLATKIGCFIRVSLSSSKIHDLFMKNPKSAGINRLYLLQLDQILASNEVNTSELIDILIDRIQNYDVQSIQIALDAILTKNAPVDSVNKLLEKTKFMTNSHSRDIILNKVTTFCLGKLSKLSDIPQSNYSDLPYANCMFRFLDEIANGEYIPRVNDNTPYRENSEYAKQQLMHLKVIRDFILEDRSNNQDVKDLQVYFADKMAFDDAKMKFVAHNELSPYRHLINILHQCIPQDKLNDLIGFAQSQYICDSELFEILDKPTPVVIVHITHYTPSDIPIDMTIQNVPYQLTGVLCKQNNLQNDQEPTVTEVYQNDILRENPNIPAHQNRLYRNVVLEGNKWLIYSDQCLNLVGDKILSCIFNGVTEFANDLKPYVLFYTRKSDIYDFTLDLNRNPLITYDSLHFDLEKIPKEAIDIVAERRHKYILNNFNVSDSIGQLFSRIANPNLLFTYFVNIYSRSTSSVYIKPILKKITATKSSLPSLSIVESLLEPICKSYKLISIMESADALSLIIMDIISNSLSDPEQIEMNFGRVVKIIERFAKLFPDLNESFRKQNSLAKIFLTFIMDTTSVLQVETHKKYNSLEIGKSLNLPSMMVEAISKHFDTKNNRNYVMGLNSIEMLQFLLYYVDESLRPILTFTNQLLLSGINSVYVTMLIMKCIKNNVFTMKDLREILSDPVNQFTDDYITQMLINAFTSLNTDEAIGMMSTIFFDDSILLMFLARIEQEIDGGNRMMCQNMLSSSYFLLNMFVYNEEVAKFTIRIASKLLLYQSMSMWDLNSFVNKIAKNFNSKYALQTISAALVESKSINHDEILQNLLEQWQAVNTNLKYNEELIDSFFDTLMNIQSDLMPGYISILSNYINSANNLQFFMDYLNTDVIKLFEANEQIISKISIIQSENLQEQEKGYEIIANFLDKVIEIDPTSTLLTKIIFNKEREFIPCQFVKFISAENGIDVPGKILVSSVNYAALLANQEKTEKNIEDDKNSYLNCVRIFLNYSLENQDKLDFSDSFINIPAFTNFTMNFESDPSSQQFLNLVIIVRKQNPAFHEIIDDEINTIINRSADEPNLVALKMTIQLDLNHDKVQNNENNVIDRIAKMHNDEMTRVSESRITSEYLYNFYSKMHFTDSQLATVLYNTSLLSSKAEKLFFLESFAKMNEDEFLKFVKLFIRKSKTLSAVKFESIDMKRVWFLMKHRPELKDKIRKMIPIEKKRVIMIAELNTNAQKYAYRVFDIDPNELSSQEQLSPVKQSPSTPGLNQQQGTQSPYQREGQSVPDFQRSQRKAQPQANNGNKPYFFVRPNLRKK